MLDDLAWRKMPRNIIRDEELDYISSILPAELAPAPLLFYVVAYCKADDEGCFDLQNGVIFSRLMKLCTAQQVMDLAKLFCDREILTCIYASATKNVYMFNDWDSPSRPGVSKSRTMEERRASVRAKIQEEQAAKKSLEPVHVDFEAERRRAASFFMLHDDKNQKNVDTTERERQRDIRDTPERQNERLETRETKENKEIETHTEGFQTFQQEVFQPMTEATEKVETKTESKDNINALVDMADDESLGIDNSNSEINESKEKSAGDIKQAFVVLKAFFTKNCLGFNVESNYKPLVELARAIALLASEKNPADTIATVFVNQFKKLTKTEGYYKNYPLTPTDLLKPGAYKTVLSMTEKILISQNESAWKYQQQLVQEAIENHDSVYDELKKACVQLGINPDTPHFIRDYLAAKEMAIK